MPHIIRFQFVKDQEIQCQDLHIIVEGRLNHKNLRTIIKGRSPLRIALDHGCDSIDVYEEFPTVYVGTAIKTSSMSRILFTYPVPSKEN